jgi:ABC-2 type transport system ATP-binding protein
MKKIPIIIFNQVCKSFALNRKRSLKWRLSNIGHIKNDPVKIIRDVTFKINQGETVGLFGPNGSGKSTILRLIANILTPDSGTILVKGKIAPVIELGSGLHPELTGRENILLYSSILGMSNQHISSHIEEIISFSELNEFIDIPIKKYSSGMKARLAFSVAIFSDANILLFDEVFAVGDTSFRDKSIRVLSQMKRSRSILLTSHDLSLMQQVCDRILILDKGMLVNEQNEALIEFINQMPMDYEFIAEATSNSMYPLIKSGDYITAKKVEFKNVKADDIILFYLSNLPEIIVHRVVDIINENNEKICITKGDSFFGLDAWKIYKSNYLGKVIKIGEKNI